MKTKAKKSRIDLMFRAFSDPTRLRILNLLRPGELCVCDLVRIINVPQPKISRHLSYLKRAGLVSGRKEGLWMHYALCTPVGKFHEKLIECLGCCLSDVPQLAKDLKKLGTCCDDSGSASCCG